MSEFRDAMIIAIRATDAAVARGEGYRWANSYQCPGGRYVQATRPGGRGSAFDDPMGVRISSYISIKEMYNEPWPTVRSMIKKNLKITEKDLA